MKGSKVKSKNNPRRYSVSVLGLLHLTRWELPEKTIELTPSISIGDYERSHWQPIIKNLADSINLDGGEALEYSTFVEVKYQRGSGNNKDLQFMREVLAGEIIDQICSIIGVINGGGAPDLVHIILFFGLKYGIHIEYFNSTRFDHSEFIFNHTIGNHPNNDAKIKINQQVKKSLKIEWKNFIINKEKRLIFSRIANAIQFYSSAWQSRNEEKALINLCIVLESLFAPHSQSEILHQLALNISKFLYSKSTEIEQRKSTFKMVKDIYRDRSKIIHGDYSTDWKKLSENTWNAYKTCAKCLNKILLSSKCCEIFRDNKRRKEFFKNLQLS